MLSDLGGAHAPRVLVCAPSRKPELAPRVASATPFHLLGALPSVVPMIGAKHILEVHLDLSMAGSGGVRVGDQAGASVVFSA